MRAICVLFALFCHVNSSFSIAMLKLKPAVASLLIYFSPFGNLEEAARAVLSNAESLTCTLDEQNSEGSTCQLLGEIVRVRAGKVLTIKQDWGGSSSTGASVWQGANMASWFLEHRVGREALAGKRLLELGGGVGFTSLVANALGAADVIVTDGNEDVLQLARENIRINVPSDSQAVVRTAQLRWSTDDELKFDKLPIDFIVASDVTYRKSAWPELIGTISRLSNPNTVTILSMEPRNIGKLCITLYS